MYGLALEGGGAMGAAHVGVLRALTENGLAPNALAGTSAGSMAAASYAWRGRMADLEDLFAGVKALGPTILDLNIVGLIQMVWALRTGHTPTLKGIFRGDTLKRLVYVNTDGATLSEAKLPLVIPSVNLLSKELYLYSAQTPVAPGAGQWQSQATLAEAVRASSSIPVVFCPLERPDAMLVDGGVLENLPVTSLRQIGVKRVLGVRLLVEDSASTPPTNLFGVAKGTLDTVSFQLDRLQERAADQLLDVVLPAGSGIFSFNRMDAFTRIGYETAMAAMPALRRFINNPALPASASALPGFAPQKRVAFAARPIAR